MNGTKIMIATLLQPLQLSNKVVEVYTLITTLLWCLVVNVVMW